MVRLAANLSFFFKNLPFAQRFGAAAACGFRSVEFMFAGETGYEHGSAAVRDELQRHGLTLALMNARAGDWSAGERGIGGISSREADFTASIEHGLRFASEVGCRRLHVMAGLVEHGADEATLVRRLKWASEAAASASVCLCVEPLNARDFPGYLVPDYPTALRVLKAVDRHAHVKLQLDLYHLAMMGGDGVNAELADAVRRLLPYAGHVQLANPPGRNEPGVGNVDFVPLLALLDELGYDGAVGCEYKPSTPTTEESLAWAVPYGIHALPSRREVNPHIQ